MTNEIKPVQYKSNGQDITLTSQMVRNQLVSGNGNVSDKEIREFMIMCKYQGLNPFLNEAYLVKFGNQPASIITSKEAFMKRANSDPHFKGFKAGILVQRGEELKKLDGAIKLPKDILIGGWAEVKRDDRDYPISVEISLDEFGKKGRDGSFQSTWKSMPMTMIRKSAVVNALREAFPEQLGAMYTEDDADINQQSDNRPKIINAQESEQTSNVDSIIENAKKQAVVDEPKAEKVDVKETETKKPKENESDEKSDKGNQEVKEALDSFKESQAKEGSDSGKATQEELFPGSVQSKFE